MDYTKVTLVEDSKLEKLATVVEGYPMAPFPQARSIGEGASLFPGLLHFTLDTYPVLLSVKLGVIKFHF